MRVLLFAVYLVMASWLLLSALLRVALSLLDGVPLDVLPALTGGLGLIAFAALTPRAIARVRARARSGAAARGGAEHAENASADSAPAR